jgi:DNA-binding MarR family transcriptional regulator
MARTASSKPLSREELAAWKGMLVVHARMVDALDQTLEREHGLPLNHYEVLLKLNEAPDNALRMGELADRLLLSRSGLTRLVDRMEARGLVERRTCDEDRRGSYAHLTEAGRTAFAQARPTNLRAIRERFLSALDEDDRRALAAVWRKILNTEDPAAADG